jgi:hypothetical protein
MLGKAGQGFHNAVIADVVETGKDHHWERP